MRRGVWSIIILLWANLASAQPGGAGLNQSDIRQLEQLTAHDPGAAVALAHTWQQQGLAIPEETLRHAVTAAVQPEAPWTAVEAAIRAFDLYQDHSWAAEAMAPWLTARASMVLVNTKWFASLHREWTKWVIERTALQTPSLLLGEITSVVALDREWSKALAEAVVLSEPALAFAYASKILAVDRPWAHSLLQAAAQAFP
jgi:hypothetical protein